MSDETETFIQEVKERVRQDKVLAAAKTYGPLLLGLFAALLLALVGWQAWSAYRLNAAREHAQAYAAAQALARAANFDDAKAAFGRLADEGPSAYRVMAQMERAAVLQIEGDLDAALAAFDQAAAAANDPVLRASAQLRAAYIVADTQDFAALQTRLTPLTEQTGPIAFLAQELLAIEAWEAGQTELARDTLANLNLAFGAPESVRQRAQLALAVLGPAPAPAAGIASAPAPPQGENE